MILESNRLLLRPLEKSDVLDIYEIFSDCKIKQTYQSYEYQQAEKTREKISFSGFCIVVIKCQNILQI